MSGRNPPLRRWPREPPGSKVLFCQDLVSTTLRQYGAASNLQKLLCCRTRRMELKSVSFPSLSPPLDSSPRSLRTEEVARWRWSPWLWRIRRWELSHRRLLWWANLQGWETRLGRRSALSSTKTSSQQGRSGGPASTPKMMEVFGPSWTICSALQLSPRIAFTAFLAAPSVRSWVLVFAGPFASMS